MNEKASDQYLETFDKIDRRIEIQNEINQTFSQYDYIIQLREFLTHLKIALNNLGRVIGHAKLNTSDQGDLLRAYSEAKFYYFSIFSTQLTFENYLYSGSKKLKATKDFHLIIDTWKRRPDVRLIKTIRNRVQHGAMLDGNLQIQENMKTPHRSQSMRVVYVIEENIWKKLVKSLDPKTRQFFNKSVKPEPDRLYFLVRKYYESSDNVFESIDSKFREIYPFEIERRQMLFQKLGEVDKWLNARGWSPF